MFGKRQKEKIVTVLFLFLGIVALHNQRLTVTDPENTYPKIIKRSLRLFWDHPDHELDKHLIGKGISCKNREALYKEAASATVVFKSDDSIGAGVFIGPRLIATAAHVIDETGLKAFVSEVLSDSLARPGSKIDIQSIHPVNGLDLAFVRTRQSWPSWLSLETEFKGDPNLMIIGHPNGKYYSLQKARIKKKSRIKSSDYILFKDNEIFFGNSGGPILGCNGKLAGVVSMMSSYQNSMYKQGIGINARTIARLANETGFI